MLNFIKKIKLDQFILLVMLILIAGYHFLIYFNSPWEVEGNSIHQIRNGNLIVIGCSFFSFLAMVILIVLIMFTKKIPLNLLVPISILIVFGVIWSAYTILFNNVSITLLLRDSFPPMSMITCGLVLVGFNDKWWSFLKKAFLIISCVFVIFSFLEIVRAYSKYGSEYRITYGAPMYLFIIGLYATYGVIVLTDEWKKKYKTVMLFLFVLLFFNSAILQGRSWFIQTIILFFIYLIKIFNYLKQHNKGMEYIIPIFIVLLVLTIFIYRIDLFEGLIFRFETSGDTRTYQLEAFFSQVGIEELIIGGGIAAGYLFNGDPNFHFIDNQVLLFLFRYGLIPTILYLYLLITPILKSLRIKNKKMILKTAVLFSWFLAMLGLGVYFNITFGMAHMLIMLYTGRLFYEVKYYQKNQRLVV